jgi:HPt (histidine-containing phosphotransfer) domain-containing protein
MKYVLHLIFVALLVGCANQATIVQKAETPSATNLYSGCVGKNSPCVAQLSVTSKPLTKNRKELREHDHTIYGHCELIVASELQVGQTAPLPQTCVSLELSLLKKSTGEERTDWIDGNSFTISGLSHGTYRLKAYSQLFQTAEELEKIQPGQEVVIQIKLKKRDRE